MSFYEDVIRPLLFRLEPESAHALVRSLLAAAGSLPPLRSALARRFSVCDPALETLVAGIRFPNPVGLAAGFDKDCRMAAALPALGFGFIEVGTVTLNPQPGNPKPRVFRFPEEEALINRLGFNGGGAAAAARRLDALGWRPVPIGVNIGLNADARAEQSPALYAATFSKVLPYGDYFAVNVSSPNTAGLRRLQETIRLERILEALRAANGPGKPVFVKLSPDLDPSELEDVVPLISSLASGIICTNTTVAREGVGEAARATRGGLSGAPLKALSTAAVRRTRRIAKDLPIIGAGGVFGPEDAFEKLRAGADLVQVYTGLVYRGPRLASAINRGLLRILKDKNLSRVADAVGRGDR